MEERDAPARALDGAGPDLATPLPAQHAHRPVHAGTVKPEVTTPSTRSDRPSVEVAEVTGMDIADTWSPAEAVGPDGQATAPIAEDAIGKWSAAEAEAVGADLREGREAATAITEDTWSAAEASEAKFEVAPISDTDVDSEIAALGGLPDVALSAAGGSQPADAPEPGGGRSVDDTLSAVGSGAPAQPAEAHRDGEKPRPYKLRRAAACAVLFVAVITTLLAFLLVIAAGTEDRAIEGHTGRADAEVLSVTTHRTLVRFQTPDGAEHVPNVGVLYPEALEEGQVVRVEYDMRNPDLVRVAGRGSTLTFLPAFTTLLAVWAVAVGLVWWLRKPGPLHLRSIRARRKLAV